MRRVVVGALVGVKFIDVLSLRTEVRYSWVPPYLGTGTKKPGVVSCAAFSVVKLFLPGPVSSPYSLCRHL